MWQFAQVGVGLRNGADVVVGDATFVIRPWEVASFALCDFGASM